MRYPQGTGHNANGKGQSGWYQGEGAIASGGRKPLVAIDLREPSPDPCTDCDSKSKANHGDRQSIDGALLHGHGFGPSSASKNRSASQSPASPPIWPPATTPVTPPATEHPGAAGPHAPPANTPTIAPPAAPTKAPPVSNTPRVPFRRNATSGCISLPYRSRSVARNPRQSSTRYPRARGPSLAAAMSFRWT